MDFQRLLLLSGLALVLMLIWQAWIEYTSPQTIAPTTQEAASSNSGNQESRTSSSNIGNDDLPSVPSAQNKTTPNVANQQKIAEKGRVGRGNRIVIETDLLRAELDSHGGDLRVLDLLTYPIAVDQPDKPFQLLSDNGKDLFYIQSGLLGLEGLLPNHHTLFEPESTSYVMGDDETVTASLIWNDGDGVKYKKHYKFYKNSYFFDIEFEIDNASNAEWAGFLYGQLSRTEIKPEQGKLGFIGRLPSYSGGAIYTPENKYDKVKFADMREKNLAATTAGGWVAMLQHYFVGAFLMAEESSYEFYSRVTEKNNDPRYHLGFKHLEPTVVAAGEKGVATTRMYVGPKEQRRMVTADQRLELTVDYGWLTPISSPLFWLMTYINKIFPNWGVSILLLTLLVKLAFYPLSAASYKSMARMKKLGPRMKTLKERYPDDRQKFQQEMMAIYKKEKVNPLGGCLPIVIQIPVFIALYWVLLESVELRQAPLALWIQDLSIPDPFYVLPILMGVSMFGQQFLNPTPPDPLQQKIMMALPVVFTVFFLWFPAGLVLYWLANNVLSIAQQWYITRKINAAQN